ARPVPAAPASEDVAKNVAKQVEDRCRVAKHRSAVVFEPGVPVAIVALALVATAQDVVGFGRLFKLLFRLLVADVAVGMILHRQLAERAFDVLFARILSDAEDLVVVPLTGHLILSGND